jgi:hypothetical protein
MLGEEGKICQFSLNLENWILRECDNQTINYKKKEFKGHEIKQFQGEIFCCSRKKTYWQNQYYLPRISNSFSDDQSNLFYFNGVILFLFDTKIPTHSSMILEKEDKQIKGTHLIML